MSVKQYWVKLDDSEKARLSTMARRGNCSAPKLARARILLKAAAGWVDEDVAQAVEVSVGAVERKHCAREGLEGALTKHRRPGKQRKLDGKRLSAANRRRACAVWK